MYQVARADKFGTSKLDGRNPIKPKVWVETNEPWHRLILDPGSNIVLTWNRVYLMTCLFALFIDPFFYYLPFVRVDNNSSCVRLDERLRITVTVLRSLADVFYMLNMVIKFRTAYVAPNTRVLGKGELVTDPKEIRRRYLRSDFFIDLVAAVPLPQVCPKFLKWRCQLFVISSSYEKYSCQH